MDAVNKESVYYVKRDQILKGLGKILAGGEVVIMMGAGDIYNLFRDIVNN